MQKAWPTATLVHLPVHASWLNQVEIYFSIVQRKVITTDDFTDLDDLENRILAFQRPLQPHRHARSTGKKPPRPHRPPHPAAPTRHHGGAHHQQGSLTPTNQRSCPPAHPT